MDRHVALDKTWGLSAKYIYELSRYLAASVIGTLAHYSLMLILIRKWSFSTVLASTCGAVTGALIIYLLNYFVTFHSQKKHLESLLKFYLTAALGVGVNGMILSSAMKYLGWPILIAQLSATTAVFSLTYTINRTWTF